MCRLPQLLMLDYSPYCVLSNRLLLLLLLQVAGTGGAGQFPLLPLLLPLLLLLLWSRSDARILLCTCAGCRTW
jgi:hypothetical protein